MFVNDFHFDSTKTFSLQLNLKIIRFAVNFVYISFILILSDYEGLSDRARC